MAELKKDRLVDEENRKVPHVLDPTAIANLNLALTNANAAIAMLQAHAATVDAELTRRSLASLKAIPIIGEGYSNEIENIQRSLNNASELGHAGRLIDANRMLDMVGAQVQALGKVAELQFLVLKNGIPENLDIVKLFESFESAVLDPRGRGKCVMDLAELYARNSSVYNYSGIPKLKDERDGLIGEIVRLDYAIRNGLPYEKAEADSDNLRVQQFRSNLERFREEIMGAIQQNVARWINEMNIAREHIEGAIRKTVDDAIKSADRLLTNLEGGVPLEQRELHDVAEKYFQITGKGYAANQNERQENIRLIAEMLRGAGQIDGVNTAKNWASLSLFWVYKDTSTAAICLDIALLIDRYGTRLVMDKLAGYSKIYGIVTAEKSNGIETSTLQKYQMELAQARILAGASRLSNLAERRKVAKDDAGMIADAAQAIAKTRNQRLLDMVERYIELAKIHGTKNWVGKKDMKAAIIDEIAGINGEDKFGKALYEINIADSAKRLKGIAHSLGKGFEPQRKIIYRILDKAVEFAAGGDAGNAQIALNMAGNFLGTIRLIAIQAPGKGRYASKEMERMGAAMAKVVPGKVVPDMRRIESDLGAAADGAKKDFIGRLAENVIDLANSNGYAKDAIIGIADDAKKLSGKGEYARAGDILTYAQEFYKIYNTIPAADRNIPGYKAGLHSMLAGLRALTATTPNMKSVRAIFVGGARTIARTNAATRDYRDFLDRYYGNKPWESGKPGKEEPERIPGTIVLMKADGTQDRIELRSIRRWFEKDLDPLVRKMEEAAHTGNIEAYSIAKNRFAEQFQRVVAKLTLDEQINYWRDQLASLGTGLDAQLLRIPDSYGGEEKTPKPVLARIEKMEVRRKEIVTQLDKMKASGIGTFPAQEIAKLLFDFNTENRIANGYAVVYGQIELGERYIRIVTAAHEGPVGNLVIRELKDSLALLRSSQQAIINGNLHAAEEAFFSAVHRREQGMVLYTPRGTAFDWSSYENMLCGAFHAAIATNPRNQEHGRKIQSRINERLASAGRIEIALFGARGESYVHYQRSVFDNSVTAVLRYERGGSENSTISKASKKEADASLEQLMKNAESDRKWSAIGTTVGSLGVAILNPPVGGTIFITHAFKGAVEEQIEIGRVSPMTWGMLGSSVAFVGLGGVVQSLRTELALVKAAGLGKDARILLSGIKSLDTLERTAGYALAGAGAYSAIGAFQTGDIFHGWLNLGMAVLPFAGYAGRGWRNLSDVRLSQKLRRIEIREMREYARVGHLELELNAARTDNMVPNMKPTEVPKPFEPVATVIDLAAWRASKQQQTVRQPQLSAVGTRILPLTRNDLVDLVAGLFSKDRNVSDVAGKRLSDIRKADPNVARVIDGIVNNAAIRKAVTSGESDPFTARQIDNAWKQIEPLTRRAQEAQAIRTGTGTIYRVGEIEAVTRGQAGGKPGDATRPGRVEIRGMRDQPGARAQAGGDMPPPLPIQMPPPSHAAVTPGLVRTAVARFGGAPGQRLAGTAAKWQDEIAARRAKLEAVQQEAAKRAQVEGTLPEEVMVKTKQAIENLSRTPNQELVGIMKLLYARAHDFRSPEQVQKLASSALTKLYSAPEVRNLLSRLAGQDKEIARLIQFAERGLNEGAKTSGVVVEVFRANVQRGTWTDDQVAFIYDSIASEGVAMLRAKTAEFRDLSIRRNQLYTELKTEWPDALNYLEAKEKGVPLDHLEQVIHHMSGKAGERAIRLKIELNARRLELEELEGTLAASRRADETQVVNLDSKRAEALGTEVRRLEREYYKAMADAEKVASKAIVKARPKWKEMKKLDAEFSRIGNEIDEYNPFGNMKKTLGIELSPVEGAQMLTRYVEIGTADRGLLATRYYDLNANARFNLEGQYATETGHALSSAVDKALDTHLKSGGGSSEQVMTRSLRDAEFTRHISSKFGEEAGEALRNAANGDDLAAVIGRIKASEKISDAAKAEIESAINEVGTRVGDSIDAMNLMAPAASAQEAAGTAQLADTASKTRGWYLRERIQALRSGVWRAATAPYRGMVSGIQNTPQHWVSGPLRTAFWAGVVWSVGFGMPMLGNDSTIGKLNVKTISGYVTDLAIGGKSDIEMVRKVQQDLGAAITVQDAAYLRTKDGRDLLNGIRRVYPLTADVKRPETRDDMEKALKDSSLFIYPQALSYIIGYGKALAKDLPEINRLLNEASSGNKGSIAEANKLLGKYGIAYEDALKAFGQNKKQMLNMDNMAELSATAWQREGWVATKADIVREMFLNSVKARGKERQLASDFMASHPQAFATIYMMTLAEGTLPFSYTVDAIKSLNRAGVEDRGETVRQQLIESGHSVAIPMGEGRSSGIVVGSLLGITDENDPETFAKLFVTYKNNPEVIAVLNRIIVGESERVYGSPALLAQEIAAELAKPNGAKDLDALARNRGYIGPEYIVIMDPRMATRADLIGFMNSTAGLTEWVTANKDKILNLSAVLEDLNKNMPSAYRERDGQKYASLQKDRYIANIWWKTEARKLEGTVPKKDEPKPARSKRIGVGAAIATVTEGESKLNEQAKAYFDSKPDIAGFVANLVDLGYNNSTPLGNVLIQKYGQDRDAAKAAMKQAVFDGLNETERANPERERVRDILLKSAGVQEEAKPEAQQARVESGNEQVMSAEATAFYEQHPELNAKVAKVVRNSYNNPESAIGKGMKRMHTSIESALEGALEAAYPLLKKDPNGNMFEALKGKYTK